MHFIIDPLLERKLLGNIIVNPDVWHEVAMDFHPDLFWEPQYKTVAEIMMELAKNGNRPSSVALYQEFRQRGLKLTPEDLKEIISGYVTSKETRQLLNELTNLYKRRTVYTSLQETIYNLEKSNLPTDELIAEAQQAMVKAFSVTNKNELATMRDVCEELFEEQSRIQSGQQPSIYPLSIDGLQTLLGGFETGTLNIIAARPSMGKTSFMLSEAIWWAEMGLPGVIFSLEQKKKQIGQRNIANIQEIPVNYLREKLDKHYLDKFNSGLSKLEGLPIKISDKRGLTTDEICSIARVEKLRNPELKWIAIDYLTCIKFPESKRRDIDVGNACLEIRNLAEELDVFVVLLSQLNRSLESRRNKRPTMADIRDSGNIEEYADSILFLYREGYYYPDFLGSEMGNWITEIEVAKNRQGGNGGKRTLAMFRQPFMQWQDCPSDWAEKYKDGIRKNAQQMSGGGDGWSKVGTD